MSCACCCSSFPLSVLLSSTTPPWGPQPPPGQSSAGRGAPPPSEGVEPPPGALTQFFSIQLRRDGTPPPAPSLQASSRELTAGTLELDTLLTIHLQVCKALLEVAEGQGWGQGPGLRVGSPLCKRWTLKVVGSVVQERGSQALGARETEELPLRRPRPGLGGQSCGSHAALALNQRQWLRLSAVDARTPIQTGSRKRKIYWLTELKGPEVGFRPRWIQGFKCHQDCVSPSLCSAFLCGLAFLSV